MINHRKSKITEDEARKWAEDFLEFCLCNWESVQFSATQTFWRHKTERLAKNVVNGTTADQISDGLIYNSFLQLPEGSGVSLATSFKLPGYVGKTRPKKLYHHYCIIGAVLLLDTLGYRPRRAKGKTIPYRASIFDIVSDTFSRIAEKKTGHQRIRKIYDDKNFTLQMREQIKSRVSFFGNGFYNSIKSSPRHLELKELKTFLDGLGKKTVDACRKDITKYPAQFERYRILSTDSEELFLYTAEGCYLNYFAEIFYELTHCRYKK